LTGEKKELNINCPICGDGKLKTTFCEKNGIFLLRISYKENIEEKLKWLMNYLKIIPKD